MPRTKEDRHRLRTLFEMLLVLAILWNVIVPALAREDGRALEPAPVRLSEAGSGSDAFGGMKSSGIWRRHGDEGCGFLR